MLWLEDEIDSVQVDIVASKEDQAKAIKREESCCNGRSNCCWQKKKTIIKKPVKKRK